MVLDVLTLCYNVERMGKPEGLLCSILCWSSYHPLVNRGEPLSYTKSLSSQKDQTLCVCSLLMNNDCCNCM